MLSPLKLYIYNIDVIVQKSTGVPIHVCGNIILIDDNHTTHHIVNPTLWILITKNKKL